MTSIPEAACWTTWHRVFATPEDFIPSTANYKDYVVTRPCGTTPSRSEITGYRVQWKESSGSWDTPADVSETTVTGTAHTITGLTDGTEYSVWVRAVNSEGTGEDKLKVLYPEDAGLVRWAQGAQRLYAKAVGWAAAGGCSSREQLTLERRLLGLCRPFLEDPLAVQGKLCRRIERHIKELFVFVSHPETPPDNNAAERSLRHLVISRKISGGARSEAGSDSKMTLSSLFGTWRARGLNPLLECRRLLVSPQL